MARIERRQQRLRHLRGKYQAHTNSHPGAIAPEPVTPDTHHHIGKSQNEYESVGTWLSRHTGDPAVKVIPFFHVS